MNAQYRMEIVLSAVFNARLRNPRCPLESTLGFAPRRSGLDEVTALLPQSVA